MFRPSNANAGFFNDPAHVTRNNCYCFASNHRADVRYALPGRRGGHPATSITCGGVIPGLRADGWQDGCQPNGLTIVMVVTGSVCRSGVGVCGRTLASQGDDRR